MKKNLLKNFKNKTVLVTGHTGFIGSWLILWLNFLGANIIGYSLKPPTNPSLFEIVKLKNNIKHIHGDVTDFKKLQKTIHSNNPEFVFHLAAQAIVRQSYKDPLTTIKTNVMGTTNILESIKNSSVKSCVVMTSDKCYDNKELGRPFIESDSMGGDDPYSVSKGAAELITSAYRNSFFKNEKIGIASVRAGNVIGGGDWSVDRLLPDCFRHISQNQIIPIRNPYAVRPWQFVLEPIFGMLSLSMYLRKNSFQYSQSWNFGPNLKIQMKVEEIVKKIIKEMGEGNYKKISNKQDKEYHEAQTLRLNSSKAKKFLNWKTFYNIDESLRETIDWYKQYYEKKDMKEFSIIQIKKFMNVINEEYNQK